LAVSHAAKASRLSVATTATVFHRLVRRGRDKYGMEPQEAQAYARQRLLKYADREYRERRRVASGGWSTWQFDRVWDEDSATWSLTPRKPKGEPPLVDWRDEYALQAQVEGRPVRVRMGSNPKSGDGYLFMPDGRRIWGLYGAAGVLFRAPGDGGEPVFFMAQRATGISGGGGTWAFPGGARDADEGDAQAAFREFGEEIGVLPVGAAVKGSLVDEVVPGEWAYTTVLVDVPWQFPVPTGKGAGDGETKAVRWVTEQQLRNAQANKALHGSFAARLDDVLDVFR
jgi:8-oxo-dGTP pyrophosphatase MutT (NUDIX family)